jgi:uncharacterized protein
MLTAEYFITKLNLSPHIEGGYFKEIYRNYEECPNDFLQKRGLASTIYYLLKSGEVSKFHCLTSDEIWFYHYGSPLLIHTLDLEGNFNTLKLGIEVENGELPQILIKAGVIFGAEVVENNSFSLVSCLVTPGFLFEDFSLFKAEELIQRFPQHEEIIKRLNS